MRIRSLALGLLVGAVGLPGFCPDSRAAAADPSALVAELGVQIEQALGDGSLTPIERQQRFHGLIDADVDFSKISIFVLGRHWQTSSDSFQQEFSRVFEDYVIQSLSVRFAEYNGAAMYFSGTRTEGEYNTIVSTMIVFPSGAPLAQIDWQVKTTPDGFKIEDVVVSGVSLALYYREQFAAVIDHDGGQVAMLIPDMRGKLVGQSDRAAHGDSPENQGTP